MLSCYKKHSVNLRLDSLIIRRQLYSVGYDSIFTSGQMYLIEKSSQLWEKMEMIGKWKVLKLDIMAWFITRRKGVVYARL